MDWGSEDSSRKSDDEFIKTIHFIEDKIKKLKNDSIVKQKPRSNPRLLFYPDNFKNPLRGKGEYDYVRMFRLNV